MDKKHKTSKHSLRQPSACLNDKKKKLRTITGHTRKSAEIFAEQKITQGNKEKRMPLDSYREMHRSVLPFYSPVPNKEAQIQQLKLCQSNISYRDLPLSFSQKTIKVSKEEDKPKVRSKLAKTKKKTKVFAEEKKQVGKREVEKDIITIRKVTKVQDDYQILYRKTEKILQEYKEREEQWQNQKATLMQELQDFRRKSMGMALTTCSSYSLNRRNMF